MPTRSGHGGTDLVGALTVNATIIAGVQQWAGSVAFAGAGSFGIDAKLFMRASATLAGVGSLAADLTKPPLIGTLAFAGAGALVAATEHFSAGKYDETGAATLTISGAAFTELEFGLKLDYDNIQTGDVLSFRVYRDGSPLESYLTTPSLTVAAHAINATAQFAGAGGISIATSVIRGALVASVAFTGAGQFSISQQLLMSAQSAFAGSGSVSAVPQLWMKGQTSFAGAGSLSVDIARLTQTWQGTLAFAGAGNLSETAFLLMAGRASFAGAGLLTAQPRITLKTTSELFAGIGNLSISSIQYLAGRVTFGGAGLLTVDLTKATQIWQATAAFAGAGLLSADGKRIINVVNEPFAGIGTLAAIPSSYLLGATAAFSGAGLQTAAATENMAATILFAGSGLLTVDLIQLGVLTASVLFQGAGNISIATKTKLGAFANYSGVGNFAQRSVLQMKAGTLAFSASGQFAPYAWTLLRAVPTAMAGAGNLTAGVKALLSPRASFSGAGLQTVNATRTINITAEAFAGIGNLTASLRQKLAALANFDGSGVFDITPRLQMRGAVAFGGAGSFSVDLTPPIIAWQGQAQFDGIGNLSSVASLQLPTSAQMDGVGGFSIDAIRFIPLSEKFSGAGSFIIGDIQQLLAGFAAYGGQGSLSVSTTVISARAEWLICASIGFKPELDALLGISPELPASLATNPALDGKPNMKAC